jgi:polyribonucleotide nucleotidyltransferase
LPSESFALGYQSFKGQATAIMLRLLGRPNTLPRQIEHRIHPCAGYRPKLAKKGLRSPRTWNLYPKEQLSRAFFSTQPAAIVQEVRYDNSSHGNSPQERSSSKATSKVPIFQRLVEGPATRFGTGTIANLTEASVVGTSGETVVLTTLAISTKPGSGGRSRATNKPNGENATASLVAHHLQRLCEQSSSSSHQALTVNYRQRHHAVGQIPTNSALRTDNRRPTDLETLASRAIDRSLRPLIKTRNANTTKSNNKEQENSIQVNCSVQSCPLDRPPKADLDNGANGGSSDRADSCYSVLGGHPVALAVNTASVAMSERLKEPVACVYLCLLGDGTVLIDPSQSRSDAICELLYAGTRDKVVMMEFSGRIPKAQLVELIQLSQGCIQPLLDAQKEMKKNEENAMAALNRDNDDDALRISLGLLPKKETISLDSLGTEEQDGTCEEEARLILQQAIDFCREHLQDAALRLFGFNANEKPSEPSKSRHIVIHDTSKQKLLLSKSTRGRREHLVRLEIERLLLEEFGPVSKLIPIDNFRSRLQDESTLLGSLSDVVHNKLLRSTLYEAAHSFGCRADGRGSGDNGSTTIRPLSMTVPALPDAVHGSALFTRGETQVLCTTTLGPPKDGILITDPFVHKSFEPTGATDGKDRPFHDLPVGSLRYLKHQEHLESDLNTRKSMADREQTGDSGTLKERRRAFLQYDFPAYSKGEVQVGSPTSANRREIGHGALAEKAILHILPSVSDFPYTIRMTSEVTSSNGSSSMASVCGATLSLLDAGVPILAPAAGVSVGLAIGDHDDKSYGLMLDITGTEDHYGAMDFKIAGTYKEVTAMQLDVKSPLPLKIVSEALDLGTSGICVILDEMELQARESSKGIVSNLHPRPEFKDTAPRVEVVRFDPARKKDLLGPGGVVIRQMEDRFDVSLDLTQEGQCLLFGEDQDMVKKAKTAVMDLVADVVVGGVYEGTVIEIRDFGIIVELLRNKEGLCHVSELFDRDTIRSHPRGTLGLIKDTLTVGQKIEVLCMAVDPVQGTIRIKPAAKLNFES